jgi:hypothetical protein
MIPIAGESYRHKQKPQAGMMRGSELAEVISTRAVFGDEGVSVLNRWPYENCISFKSPLTAFCCGGRTGALLSNFGHDRYRSRTERVVCICLGRCRRDSPAATSQTCANRYHCHLHLTRGCVRACSARSGWSNYAVRAVEFGHLPRIRDCPSSGIDPAMVCTLITMAVSNHYGRFGSEVTVH